MKIIQAKSPTVWLFSLIVVLVFALTAPASGNVYAHNTRSNKSQSLTSQQVGEIIFENVSVEIWPEYDKPEVLIIYRATLSAEVGLPAALRFRIPTAVGKPFAVAWQATDKALYDINYDTTPAGEWTEVEFTTPAPDIQIEYYDPGLKKAGNRREFTYRWPGTYAVQNLSLQVQQPHNASNMQFAPYAGSGRAGDNGLIYYSLLVGKVDAGTSFKLDVSYDKPDDTLTNPKQFQPAKPSQPLDNGASGRMALDQYLPWGVGGLGFLLIAAGIFWYWKTGRISSNKTFKRPRHSGTEKQAPDSELGSEIIFCHQCGKKAGPRDTFCRTCGSKLRQ